MKMKIAYIVPSLVNQGPIVVVNLLVKYLKNYVEQIDVYYFDDKLGMQFDCPTYLIKEEQRIDFDSYDVIHSHCLRPDRYVIKWKDSIYKAKIITTLHQDTFVTFRFQYNKITSSLYSLYWLRLQKKFDGITTISNQLREKYDHRLGGGVITIYNGCDVSFNDLRLDFVARDKILSLKKQKLKIIGTYAFVTKRKGLHQVLKALTILKDFAFVIIGEGPEISYLKGLALKLGISNRILFIDYQMHPYNYLIFFDLYVMPSYSEGFGLSMVEAALAKKAIVCSNIDSFHEIFTKKEAQFFDLDDMNSLVTCIIEAYKYRFDMGEKAYLSAKSRFLASMMADNFFKYYTNLLNEI